MKILNNNSLIKINHINTHTHTNPIKITIPIYLQKSIIKIILVQFLNDIKFKSSIKYFYNNFKILLNLSQVNTSWFNTIQKNINVIGLTEFQNLATLNENINKNQQYSLIKKENIELIIFKENYSSLIKKAYTPIFLFNQILDNSSNNINHNYQFPNLKKIRIISNEFDIYKWNNSNNILCNNSIRNNQSIKMEYYGEINSSSFSNSKFNKWKSIKTSNQVNLKEVSKMLKSYPSLERLSIKLCYYHLAFNLGREHIKKLPGFKEGDVEACGCKMDDDINHYFTKIFNLLILKQQYNNFNSNNNQSTTIIKPLKYLRITNHCLYYSNGGNRPYEIDFQKEFKIKLNNMINEIIKYTNNNITTNNNNTTTNNNNNITTKNNNNYNNNTTINNNKIKIKIDLINN